MLLLSRRVEGYDIRFENGLLRKLQIGNGNRQSKIGDDSGLHFPGQGSQYPGMGKDLVENFPAAAQVFGRNRWALNFELSNCAL